VILRTCVTTHIECARTERRSLDDNAWHTVCLRRFCGLFCTQHVFTAAQGSYTQNILDRLDPGGTIFETVLLWLYRIKSAREHWSGRTKRQSGPGLLLIDARLVVCS